MIKLKGTKKELFFEIIRFLIVGGTATIVEYGLFALLNSLIGFNPFMTGLCQAIAFLVSLLVNWFLSIIFVYKNVEDKEKSRSFKSFLIFALIGLIGMAISSLGVALGELIPATGFNILGNDLRTWIVKCILTLIVLVWNYLGRKIFIFK